MASTKMSATSLADPVMPQTYRVSRVCRELSDTVTLELMPLAGPRPAFAPGQFNMLYAFGIGEVAISLSGNCADKEVFVHTIRDVGAVSGAIAKLETGATIGLRGPFGTGWPVAAAEGSDVVIVAGGLGLAALAVSMGARIIRSHDVGPTRDAIRMVDAVLKGGTADGPGAAR